MPVQRGREREWRKRKSKKNTEGETNKKGEKERKKERGEKESKSLLEERAFIFFLPLSACAREGGKQLN